MNSSEIAALLPSVFQRTLAPATPLDALLRVMEALHAPAEDIVDSLDAICDCHRTDDNFVPYLASWVDLERIFAPHEDNEGLISTGVGRLRELIGQAAYLSKWRGTRKGLKCFLETAVGATGFEIDEPADQPFHLRVTAPGSLQQHRALIERIVNVERPAYATWEVQFAPAPPATP